MSPSDFSQGLAFLSQLDLYGIVMLFWFFILFEFPRYVVAFAVITFTTLFRPEAGRGPYGRDRRQPQ